MAILAEHHTPKSFAEALDLLAERTSRRVPLAGGTHLIGALESRQRQDVDGVVNLAGLDLAFFLQDESVLRIGAMTTITDLIQHPACADLAGSILPRTARFEGPLNLRNAATVGGLAALAEPDSELYAALLALNASVVAVDRQGFETRWQLDASPFPSLSRRLRPCSLPRFNCRLARLPAAMRASHAHPWTGASSPPLPLPSRTANLRQRNPLLAESPVGPCERHSAV